MNLKKFSIGNQLFFSITAILIAIVILGAVSFYQSEILYKQTEKLYNHPLNVRRAIAEVEIGIAKMRISSRDLLVATKKVEQDSIIQDGLRAEQDVETNFKEIYSAYLGPKVDIDNAYAAYKVWNEARKMNNVYTLEGKLDEVKHNISPAGNVAILRNNMLAKVNVISDFAKNKATSFYLTSKSAAYWLTIELLIICIVVSGFTIFIGFYLARKIRRPLKELQDVVTAYRAGDLDVRSTNDSGNEIGTVATVLNDLLDNVKVERLISEKISRIADSMLIEDNSHRFFRSLLPVLAVETNSQIAAVYLLDDSNSEFYLYESVGLNAESKKMRFMVSDFEGEFGAALATKKIQFVRNIPLETIYTYKTVSGNMVPREIVTIPILVGDKVIAMLSLAAVRKYTTETVNMIYKIYDVLTARIDGIMAYREMRKTAARLREQNIELEQQRNELNQQSTELAQQNAELEVQKNQLKEASRLKTTFLSNMSHELRTPLNSVIALSGVLNRRLLNKIPEDEYSYIGVIERNGRHLLTLINDILDISRIEAGREEVEINEFEINDAIADVVEMIRPQANERKIQLVQLKKENRIILQSDSKKVRHILQNLIANAVKFTEKGSVEVWVKNADKKISVHIKDTGIGITPEHLEHIFDEFRQADSSTSRRFGGTGLGLSIARKYARLLGGDIQVTSVPDKGSEFTLVLPEKAGEKVKIQEIDTTFELLATPSVSVSKLQEVAENKDTKYILLVEDSEPAIIQIQDMLESNNYIVKAARSGAEAIRLLADFTPDAMILDLQMPMMDGFELLEKIRNFEKTKDVPVLILTAKHITKEDITMLKNNNIHQLIQKGDVQRDALLHAVYSMVATPELLQPEGKPRRDAMHSVSTESLNTEHETQNTKRKTQTVLIVEDNPDNMTTVKAVIGDKFKVIEAVNGVVAVQKAQEFVPDFVLMDIALPELDGIEAFRQIRNNPRLNHISVVALTASAMLSDRETILAYGFDAYIPKPIDEKHFFEILNKVLYGK